MPWNDPEIQKFILVYITKKYKPTSINILDVGPGAGVYGNNLKPHFYIDAVEIFETYIYKYKLFEKYNNIMWGDIIKFNTYDRYDLAIVADVFEHMTFQDSRTVFDRMMKSLDEVIVSLPFESEQGPECGNRYESHIQDDLTPEIVKERYPELTEIYRNDKIGKNGLAVYSWTKDGVH